MNSLVKIAVNIIEWLRAHRLPIVVVSAVIVMIVSYALVLPALTMTLDKALEQGGISLSAETESTESYEESEKQDSISPDDEAEDEIYEEAEDQDSVSPEPEAEDGDHEELEKKDGSSSDAEPEEETYAEPVQPVKKKGLRGGMSLMATPDPTIDNIDVNKSYLICYQVGETYYLLKNDGTTDSSHTPAQFDSLNSKYCWTFNYVFQEKHDEDAMMYNYYLIRPIDNKTKTIALNAEGQDLVQRSNNNVAVVPAKGGGYKLIGYNDVKLAFDNEQFFAKKSTESKPFDGVTVHIYEMTTLPTYTYTAESSDETRGTVTIQGGTPKEETVGEDDDAVTLHYYEAESNSEKKNAGTITATPASHQNPELQPWDVGYGQNKWQFDHWTLDGISLDRDQYPATINTNTLSIPHNEAKLVAYFKQNPNYVVPDDEKIQSNFEDMTTWLTDLTNNRVPLDEDSTTKTAEVYDYQNRIYRVDIASKANFKTFKGNVDMAFCMDVSNSMYFPSKLEYYTELPIYQINNDDSTKAWLDKRRTYNNPYYLIADPSNTATNFKVYWDPNHNGGQWCAIDASRTTFEDSSGKPYFFGIGQDDFETTWTGGGSATDKKHPFNSGDNNNTTYTIYNAGDDGRNRFHYLNQSFKGAISDLKSIRAFLQVAGNESPNVRVAYNTFNKDLGNQRGDFANVNDMSVDGINLSNASGGGTRPDQAFKDALTFQWQGHDRYVVLITDGAPQGKRTGETLGPDQIVQEARNTAAALKKGKDGILGTDDDVKVITIGLSLDNVPSGKKLLYDIADNDKNGEKMFFMAEKASDLPNILRQVTNTIMDEAVVMADVTDTVGEAFYAVDKNTGLPLKAGDMVDIEGCKTKNTDNGVGIVQADGVTIKWIHQDIDPMNGWRGTIYVKAKEDFLGGNAMETNGSAKIEATSYKMDGTEHSFIGSALDDKLKSKEIDFNSPRVNVNELTFTRETTEWTVYIGTEVDPKAQLKKMYEDIIVKQVVNDDGSLHYDISPDNIHNRSTAE